ncbi:hypothetical protein [Streptomyces sp. NPDC020681]|uniref:F0F1 ATP synthase subunit B family protein n=1 Tax=Streptomyces sp. NPDC020681 TaxID=3365083 RepID=UPI0037BD7AD1
MNDDLIPIDIGPLNPTGWGLIIGFLSFGIVYAVMAWRILPRAARIIQQREQKTQGVAYEAEQLRDQAEEIRAQWEAVLAEARHDAAHTRQRAHEEGTTLIVAARAEGLRERERILAEGAASIEAERTVAEAELRDDVDIWARALAERILGEPVSAPADGSRTTD